jgi:hypothetical protein
MNIQIYDKILQQFLQSKVIIKVDNKILKTGKLKLFNIKQYFIRLHIENDKNAVKILELPYPFLMKYNEGEGCTLNYKLTSLCNNHREVVNILRSAKGNTHHKIYDNEVSIIALN